MTFPNDQWVDNHRLIPPECAHAIGLVSLYANFIESGLRSILLYYSGMNDKDGARFTHAMRGPQMATILSSLVSYKEEEERVVSYLVNALKVADVCRENRNILCHSWINISGEKLHYQKQSKSPDTKIYDFDSLVIRRVADECFECGAHFMDLALYIKARGVPYRKQGFPAAQKMPDKLVIEDTFEP